ncbi:MAG: site-specific integrase [Oscillospiraceae bacterium]|nr:site-specific integrase [Oscillospiraceae bacterium]
MAKRANGEGSIRKKPNGHWELQIMDGWKPNGKRNIRSFSGRTQKEVKQKRDDYLRKKTDGLLAAENLRFDDWANSWFDGRKDDLKVSSQESYQYTLRILIDHFGSWKIADIKAMHIEAFLRKLRQEGRSDSALAHCRSMLHSILNKAVANDLLSKNPVALAEKLKKQPTNTREAFTEEEVRILLRDLPDDRIGSSIKLMLCTAIRSHELLGLESRHISEDGAYLTIEQAVVMDKGVSVIGDPKSASSRRVIPVPEIVQYCARNLRNTDKKYIWEAGKPGHPCNPSYFRNQFRKALENIEGVRVLTPHCCRHTCASLLLSCGVDPKTIQQILGHAKVDMTFHYTHSYDALQQNAMDRLSKKFSSNHLDI